MRESWVGVTVASWLYIRRGLLCDFVTQSRVVGDKTKFEKVVVNKTSLSFKQNCNTMKDLGLGQPSEMIYEFLKGKALDSYS